MSAHLRHQSLGSVGDRAAGLTAPCAGRRGSRDTREGRPPDAPPASPRARASLSRGLRLFASHRHSPTPPVFTGRIINMDNIDKEFDLLGFLVAPLTSEDGKTYVLPKKIKCMSCGRTVKTTQDTIIHSRNGWECHDCYN